MLLHTCLSARFLDVAQRSDEANKVTPAHGGKRQAGGNVVGLEQKKPRQGGYEKKAELTEFQEFSILRWLRGELSRTFRHLPPAKGNHMHKKRRQQIIATALSKGGIHDMQEKKRLVGVTEKFITTKLGVLNSEVKTSIMKRLRRVEGKFGVFFTAGAPVSVSSFVSLR